MSRLQTLMLVAVALAGCRASEQTKTEKAYRECEAYHEAAMMWFARHQVPDWPKDVCVSGNWGLCVARSEIMEQAIAGFLREQPPGRDPWGNDYELFLHNWSGSSTWKSCFCVVSNGPNGQPDELTVGTPLADNDDIVYPPLR